MAGARVRVAFAGRRREVQDGIRQARQSPQAGAVIQVAGDGRHPGQAQCVKAFRRMAQGKDAGAASQLAGNAQAHVPATHN